MKIFIVAIISLLAEFALTVGAQAQIGNCPGRWINNYCVCPNGQPASATWDGFSSHYFCAPSAPRTPSLPPGAVSCGGGRYCGSGQKCVAGGGCMPSDAVSCGGGRYCNAGQICTADNKCTTQEAIDERRRLEQLREQQAKEQQRIKQQQLLEQQTRLLEQQNRTLSNQLRQKFIEAEVNRKQAAQQGALTRDLQQTLKEKLAAQSNQYNFESILNDPKQSIISRQLAAAVLNKEIPNNPSLSNSFTANPTPNQPAPQMTQAEREILAAALGKARLAKPTQTLSLDEQMRATINDPNETPAARQIAAIGLGINPGTLGLGNSRAQPTSASTAPSVTPNTSPPNQQSTVPPGPGQSPNLNPNLSTDIATLTPPAVPRQNGEPRVESQPKTPATTFPSNPSGGQSVSILDSDTAKRVLPYALMSRDVYSDTGGELGTATQWKRIAAWDTFMQQNGVSQPNIEKIRNSGFYAAIYRNQLTGDVSIAFRGTAEPGNAIDFARDMATNTEARTGLLPIQYEAASSLTSIAKVAFGTNLNLTGHSLGGALASYAGVEHNIRNVITFNAARNYFSDGAVKKPSQLNVFTKGELIGDPAKAEALGSGQLPGEGVVIDSTATNQNILDDVLAVHKIDNMIGPITDAIIK